MEHFKFNHNLMKKLLNKISLENNRCLIVGDFNLNLIKYRQIAGVNQLLEVLLTNNVIPQITLPTPINQKSATRINNLFPNYHEHQRISGNLKTYIFDHLPQFIIENENLLDRNDDKLNIRIIKTLN